ncbi:MAG: hypothetical protein D6696_20115 [Acidobacteria bacterium]|nr:MAG: hypothetical protein D6696_20115 [Acidobacteriota bacterium]
MRVEVRRAESVLVDRSAAAATAAAGEETSALGARRPAVDEVLYSVRVPAVPAVVACPRCDGELIAAGPTGYADDEPICDSCLFAACQQLGMMLALASVSRTYAIAAAAEPRERRAALAELGAFARIYERFAARHAPLRLFVPRPAGRR